MKLWMVIPAAGSGRRMGSGTPKQYLRVAGATVMEHTVNRLCAVPGVSALVVAVAPDDAVAVSLPYRDYSRLRFVCGGAERADSVLAGLRALHAEAGPDDWVLVHDVARPCVGLEDIARLIDTLRDDPVGGILACPVRDTLKRETAGSGRISETVTRTGVWQAQTPQMFRYGLLSSCLTDALAAGADITDESSAVEWAGHAPRLVAGSSSNIKITFPDDLACAGFLLEQSS